MTDEKKIIKVVSDFMLELNGEVKDKNKILNARDILLRKLGSETSETELSTKEKKSENFQKEEDPCKLKWSVGGTIASAFAGVVMLGLGLGALLIPVLGWILGLFLIPAGIISVLFCWLSKTAKCPHCGEDASYTPLYLGAHTCPDCKTRITARDGMLVDLTHGKKK